MRKMYSENQIKKIIEESPAINLNGEFTSASAKIFENIKDAKGHNRFIEGDINLFEDVTTITKTYGKWSLSGTHLLIVLCGAMEHDTVHTGKYIANIGIPQWVKDKIFPLHSTSAVDNKSITLWGGTNQNTSVYLEKRNDTTIAIYFGAVTINGSDKTFRISFDLLIDNE